ncbi:DUF3883 domain-containing protein [Xanthomonas campestris pv. raphani]|uniref:protein NO VEIN domain-containing protein n=1 Tax=Xanthomonas campestris TaxID=339 RepID=UPI002B22D753|nr:DUF3883 domain-containing protein [Xanthomonas campestris]MEA9753712.1 DUF3883 domain-containing protein [Xanthomonas campestris pv. raphani]MEA9955349.1 DUF3883 domain-containing protein [Xanthomonas campestris pv. raphani]MEA9959409.1 DUF3883 domain-containing protein [Xanthomonas campestris pv. raphani]
MDRYDGPGNIRGGGSYVNANGVGGEVYNFKPSRGICFGYAMSLHGGGINLRFLAPDHTWEPGDALHGVDVIFIARHKERGQVVVGWYRNASVFHKQYRNRRGTIPGMNFEKRHYLCFADQENVTLLPEEKRTFAIPYAPVDGPGYPGQSNVWYPERSSNPAVPALIKKLRNLMTASSGAVLAEDEFLASNTTKNGRRRGKPDAAMNALVEKAAVEAVVKHYKSLKYTVRTVEKENLGWDLEVSLGAKTQKIEVKGVSSDSIYFELTPNEYKKLREHSKTYSVCVVCMALEAPFLYHLTPCLTDERWSLVDKKARINILLEERMAAIGRDVANPSDFD